MNERRTTTRHVVEIAALVEAGGRTWTATVLNYSPSGALLALQGAWEGDRDLVLRLDPHATWEGFTSEAQFVRASEVGSQTHLAVRFV